MSARVTRAIADHARYDYLAVAIAVRWRKMFCAATKARLGRACAITIRRVANLYSKIGLESLIVGTLVIDFWIVAYTIARRSAILRMRTLVTALDHQMWSLTAHAARHLSMT